MPLHTDVAFFDVLDPAFRVDSPEVRAAAEAGWWARTSIGIAVLRYPECVTLLRDRHLRNGIVDAVLARGVSSGAFFDWLRMTLLNLEGEAHQRLVTLFLATANTEPETFGSAPFDITAPRAAHLTFGGGVHYCLGTWLARIEMREALPILASRLGDIALDGPVASRPHIGITGPIALPLRFTGP